MQNPMPNQACAMNMNMGANAINGCCNSFMGQPFGNQFAGGPISNFAMAGAGPGGSFAFAGNNGLNGGFNNLFQPPFGGGGGNSAFSAGFQAGLSGGMNNGFGGGFNNGFGGGFNNGGFGGGFNSGGFGNGLGFGSPFAGGLPFGGSNLNLSLGISLQA